MGTELPEFQPGRLCLHCWGSSRVFDGEVTPHVMRASFTGWEPAEQWNESYRHQLESPRLIYQAASPCAWSSNDGLWEWSWSTDFIQVFARVWIRNMGMLAFSGGTGPQCTISLPNELTNPSVRITKGGIFTIDWIRELE